MAVFLLFELFAGLLLYRIKSELLPCFWLILQTLALPLVAYMAGVSCDEEIGPAYGQQNKIVILLFVICIVIDFYKYKQWIRSFDNVIIFSLLIVIIRLLWEFNYNTHTSILEIIYSERYSFFILLLPIILFCSNTTTQQLSYTIIAIVFIEIFMMFINYYLHIYLYSYHYFLPDNSYNTAISGTFRRFSVLAAFLAIIQSFVSNIYIIHKYIKIHIFLFFTLCIGCSIAMTGSRTGFYAYILSIIIPALFHYKSNRLLLGSFLIGGICSLLIFSTFKTSNTTKDAENGFERIMYGIIEKTNKSSYAYGEGTDNMSYDLVKKYATINPLGNGYSSKFDPESAYKMSHVQDDCILAYLFVDKGWLYCLCYFMYFFTIIKTITSQLYLEQVQGVYIMFFIALLITFTDEGIFSNLNFGLITLYAYWLNRKNIEEYE